MRVGLCGFTGCGNIGDQAMALVLVDELAHAGMTPVVFAYGTKLQELDQLVSHGAEVVPHTARYTQIDRLVIGGGELGPGFGWHIAGRCLCSSIPVHHYGQSYATDWLHPAGKRMLQELTSIHARDVRSVMFLDSIGVHAGLCADPAYGLDPPPPTVRKGTLLYIRHPNAANPDQERTARELATGDISVAGCSDEDVEYALKLFPRAKYSWPTTVQSHLEAVASAERVVTVGRYHPAVFAHICGTPCVASGEKVLRTAVDAATVSLAAQQELHRIGVRQLLTALRSR